MLLDHIGAAILLFVFRAQGRQEPLNTIYDVLRDVGRIAFPLFIFLLTEGLAHSRNAGRYLLRLFIFALVSEVPFDLAFYGVFPYWDKQNVFFTLLLGLAAICCMDRIRKGAAPHLKGTVRVVYVAMLSLICFPPPA